MRSFIIYFIVTLLVILGSCIIANLFIRSNPSILNKYYSDDEVIKMLDVWYDKCSLDKTKDIEICNTKYIAATNLCFIQRGGMMFQYRYVDTKCVDYYLNKY